MKNKNLHKAKIRKNDEFYTQLRDIENELKHYKEHFKGKIIYCNCDHDWSNFVKFLKDNKHEIQYKELYNTGLTDEFVFGDYNVGDFRNRECIELLKEADIVVTNPPFSLFREYVSQLAEYNKKFVIIGNQNAITYKEVFKLIKENKMWTGVSPRGFNFKQPDGSLCNINATWFTNLDYEQRYADLVLYKKYTPEEYPHYDNYDAINVDKTKDIPCDWEGAMGVPITFLDKYNPEQFEILGFSSSYGEPIGYHYKEKSFDVSIKGINLYKRLFIKNKKPIK